MRQLGERLLALQCQRSGLCPRVGMHRSAPGSAPGKGGGGGRAAHPMLNGSSACGPFSAASLSRAFTSTSLVRASRSSMIWARVGARDRVRVEVQGQDKG